VNRFLWPAAAIAAGALALGVSVAVAGPTTQQTVWHDNDNAWKIDNVGGGSTTFEVDQCNPTATPIGDGALHLLVTDGSTQAAQLRSTRYHRTYLRSILTLKYSTCARFNNGQQWPYIILNVDYDGDNNTDDLLFFEPAYQDPAEGSASCPDQGEEMFFQWQRWDARNGCWWSLEGTAGATPGSGVKPLSVIIAAEPNAAIVNPNGNHGGVRLVQGFGDPVPHDGWVDAFEISDRNANSNITYNFEEGPN